MHTYYAMLTIPVKVSISDAYTLSFPYTRKKIILQKVLIFWEKRERREEKKREKCK